MSTEWIQILIVVAVYAVLVIAAGRYLLWRRWDRERRIEREARRFGLREFYDKDVTVEFTEPPWGQKEGIRVWLQKPPDNPGFSKRV